MEPLHPYCLSCPFWPVFAVWLLSIICLIIGLLNESSRYEQLKKECERYRAEVGSLRDWADGVDKVPMDVSGAYGHVYVVLGSEELWRRKSDEKGNWEGEWEEVQGPEQWRVNGRDAGAGGAR